MTRCTGGGGYLVYYSVTAGKKIYEDTCEAILSRISLCASSKERRPQYAFATVTNCKTNSCPSVTGLKEGKTSVEGKTLKILRTLSRHDKEKGRP